MKKYVSFILVFLFVVSFFFIYKSYQLIQQLKIIEQELAQTNQLYDENIQYNIQLEDSLKYLHKNLTQLKEDDHFSLTGNPKALKYLYDTAGEEDINWDDFILSELLKTNDSPGNNKLVPFDGMDGPMKIDRAKVLNNKWILAHFTDGTYQGEMLLKYEVNKNKKIRFKVLDETLYP
jgi:hypothetical protein